MRIFFRGGQWSNVEDSALLALVQKNGLNRWSSIATTIGRKSEAQCKARWEEWLDPAINKGPWSLDEKRILVEAFEVFPEQWATIASQLPRRRPWQCQEMYAELRDGGDFKPGTTGTAPGGSGADGETTGTSTAYTLFHEMTRARRDTVDGDDYQRQVLEFTQARVSNQKNKKQLRKERQSMLAQSQLVADLERRREMEAIGIETHTQKKAFARALREDEADGVAGSKRPRSPTDTEGRTAARPALEAPVDLSTILTSQTSLRQASSHQKTELFAGARAGAKHAQSGPAQVIANFSLGTAASLSSAAAGAAGTSSFAQNIMSALLGEAPPPPTRDLIKNNGAGPLAITAGVAVPKPLQVQAGLTADDALDLFDDLPVPQTAKATADNDDLFGDIPAPQPHQPKETVPITAAAVDTASATATMAPKQDDKSESDEEDEEDDSRPFYYNTAEALVRAAARRHWVPSGFWSSLQESRTYLQQAKALIEVELERARPPVMVEDPSQHVAQDNDDDRAVSAAVAAMPPLVHPRVVDLMGAAYHRNGKGDLVAPSDMALEELECEVKGLRDAVHVVYGLEPNTQPAGPVQAVRAPTFFSPVSEKPKSVKGLDEPTARWLRFQHPNLKRPLEELASVSRDTAEEEKRLYFYRDVALPLEQAEVMRRELWSRNRPVKK